MSHDQRFQMRLDVPEWNISASCSDFNYIVALSGLVDSYERKANRDGVKTPLSPQASDASTLLGYKTANQALKFLVEKLQLDSHFELRRDDDPQGPQWTHKIKIRGIKTLEIPTIRQADSRYIATTITVVRLLQRFGFDNMRGFRKYLQLGKRLNTEQARLARRAQDFKRPGRSHKSPAESERLDRVEQAVTSTSEETLGQPNASSRDSRR